jgi:perosamine synthetase
MTRFVTEAFERQFAETFDVPDAIAVNSGTSALIAALWSLELQPGYEVITTPFTFMATVNAILIAGGTPVFADIDPETYLIDPRDMRRKITDRTRALLPVHLFGRVCPMAEILDLRSRYDLVVIEDTAQALGARQGDRYAGTLADAGCFSFYKTKNLSTFEGGMIAIPDRSRLDAMAVRAIANQGDVGGKRYEWIGFNFRMPEPCALIGLEQLKLHWPGVLAELGRYGIDNGYYPQLVYETPAYRRLGLAGDCPVAERLARYVAEQQFGKVQPCCVATASPPR